MKNSTKTVIDGYISKYSFLNHIENEIMDAYSVINDSFNNGGKLLICGNGGSAADADHIVGELMKDFIISRKLPKDYIDKYTQFGTNGIDLAKSLQGAFPTINLGAHTSLLTAIINDVGSESIFAQQVLGYGQEGDVLLGISTSGNSKNVINAGMVSRVQNLKTIALTGQKGGKMSDLFDIMIKVPSTVTDEIQNMHSAVYHLICAMLECERWER